jgi:hypothetical protein
MNDSDGLIREINDAVRQEKWQGFMQHFGHYIIIITVLIIGSTTGYVLWKGSIEEAHQEATQKLYHAIELVEGGEAYKARSAFDTLSKGQEREVGMLANLWRVKLKHVSGNHAQASEMAASLQDELRKKEAFAVYSDYLTLYQPVPEEEQLTGTFRLTNMERLAASHLKEKQLEEATALYQRIANDNDAPQSMRNRARMMLDDYLLPTTQLATASPQQPEPQESSTTPETDESPARQPGAALQRDESAE